MIRITLVLLLGLAMFASFPAQAGHRDGHYNKHFNDHQYRHRKHRNKHHGHHHYSHGDHHYRCRHDSHYRYGGYVQFNTVPPFVPGSRVGYSAGGAVIIYQAYPPRGY